MAPRKPLDVRTPCAACGKPPVVTKTTFLCCNVERHICNACWNKGENDEAWDMDISNQIQLRDRRLARTQTPAKKRKRS